MKTRFSPLSVDRTYSKTKSLSDWAKAYNQEYTFSSASVLDPPSILSTKFQRDISTSTQQTKTIVPKKKLKTETQKNHLLPDIRRRRNPKKKLGNPSLGASDLSSTRFWRVGSEEEGSLWWSFEVKMVVSFGRPIRAMCCWSMGYGM